MAGTLEIADNLCWMPAGWVFNAVLHRLAQKLKGMESQLAERLEGGTDSPFGGYLDFRDADQTTFSSLTQAAAGVLADVQEAGPDALADPTYFGAFVEQLRQLISMLNARLATG